MNDEEAALFIAGRVNETFPYVVGVMAIIVIPLLIYYARRNKTEVTKQTYIEKFKQTLPRKLFIGTISLVLITLLVDWQGMPGWLFQLITFVPLSLIQIWFDYKTGYAK